MEVVKMIEKLGYAWQWHPQPNQLFWFQRCYDEVNVTNYSKVSFTLIEIMQEHPYVKNILHNLFLHSSYVVARAIIGLLWRVISYCCLLIWLYIFVCCRSRYRKVVVTYCCRSSCKKVVVANYCRSGCMKVIVAYCCKSVVVAYYCRSVVISYCCRRVAIACCCRSA